MRLRRGGKSKSLRCAFSEDANPRYQTVPAARPDDTAFVRPRRHRTAFRYELPDVVRYAPILMPSVPAVRCPGGIKRVATSESDPTNLSASELVQAIARNDLPVTDVVEAHIARIESVNPELNAVVVPLFDDARKRARAADQMPISQRGPLHGVPVTVKESFDVAGTPSTAGINARRGHRAAEDALLVRKLREAGAIILGKTNVPQLLIYVEADNPVYGCTNNPLDHQRSPGGSSGGEGAIVAARGAALGLGADLGGSARIPGHCCGIHAFKPTPGRLPAQGTVPVLNGATQSGIVDSGGLLARSVADIRLAFGVLSPPEVTASPLEGIRVGFYEDDGFFTASPAIRRAVRSAADTLSDAGCEVKRFSLPDAEEGLTIFFQFFAADRGMTWRTHLANGPVDPRVTDLLKLVGTPNWLRPVASTVLRFQGQERLSRAVRIPCGGDGEALAGLIARRDAYRNRVADAMTAAGVDVLLCPPCSVPAFTHGATKDLGPASLNYTAIFNLLGYPAGVVTTMTVREDETRTRPRSREKMVEAARVVDLGSAGLPVGVQVAAAPAREDRVLAVMAALEEQTTTPGR